MTDGQKTSTPAPTPPESPFSLNFVMIDGYGSQVQITMRQGVGKDIIAQVFDGRKYFVELALEHGWQFPSRPQAAPVAQAAAPATNVPPAANGNGAAPAAAQGGATLTFAAETLSGSITDGKTYWKVKGGQFTKFGVTVWPETLAAAGFDVKALNPAQSYSLAGLTAEYTTKPDGKAEKVVRLVK